jgi:heterodisulfide reductase subunit A
LNIQYLTPEGHHVKEDFDLVVLSVGVQTRPAMRHLLDELGILTSCHGFPILSDFDPTATSREGVFACGILTGPMDIPESVLSSSAAAASAARYIFQEDGGFSSAEITGQSLPDEKDITGVPPRIGVVVCRCGTNIGSVVDVASAVEQVKDLPNVSFALDTTYACAKDSITALVEEIRQKGVNRVVIASCSPRTHEPLFRSAIREAGLNRYLLQMTNIRDQCSWVHQEKPEDATEKAVDLIRMAVGKARLLKPLSESETAVEKSSIVVGGGIAGMSAALATASSGFQVHLIEQTGKLGGNAATMYSTLAVPDVPAFLDELISRVNGLPGKRA